VKRRIDEELWRTQTACTGCGKELDGWIEKGGNKFCNSWCAKQYYGCKKWGMRFGEYRSEQYSEYLYKKKLTQTFKYCVNHGIKNRHYEFCPQCGVELRSETISGKGKMEFDKNFSSFAMSIQNKREVETKQ
jgi:hypothetical protein